MVTTAEQIRRSVIKPTFICDEEYVTENDELAAIEVKMKKTRITDDVPVHFATAILQWSKVLFYR